MPVLSKMLMMATGGAVGGLGLFCAMPSYNEYRRTKDQTEPGVYRGIIKPILPRFGSVEQCKLSLEQQKSCAETPLLCRSDNMNRLKDEEYDVLVIGGGATGCGVALDAVSRGLKTALVEKYDFASGTSSKSTKLIHGGVRYLQKAIFQRDMEQYKMVREALSERANLLDIAPHLAFPLPIMLPIYKWWQVPYYWLGIKAYDVVAWEQILKPSYYLTKSKALELFPMLKKEKLVGALVYYDGMHDDARMCLSLALTAARMGASTANYTEIIEITKCQNNCKSETVNGAIAQDRLTGDKFKIHAKCVINATGPYTDGVRQMDSEKTGKICQPSSGVHVVLPDYYSPANMGLLDPSTSDGRVIFFLPWQNATMAGTTDTACELSDSPSPTEEEVQFILCEIRNYLNPDVNVRRGDVMSAWSGIRPLVLNPDASDTQSLARNHIIEVSKSKLITIAGGKWTTYRSMAEETVDKAIEVCNLKPKTGCVTKGLLLEGAHNYKPTLFIRLVQDFGIDVEVAKHLAQTYGGKAVEVAKLATPTGKRWPIVGNKLHEEFPYLEAEVLQACKEYACSATDVIARRTRLAFLSTQAAEEALPKICDIMGKELGWSAKEKMKQHEDAMEFIRQEMGRGLAPLRRDSPINLTRDEINLYMHHFASFDTDKKGFITLGDLRKYFKSNEQPMTEEQLHDILSEVDLSKNGRIDHGEFLQIMLAAQTRKTHPKYGHCSYPCTARDRLVTPEGVSVPKSAERGRTTSDRQSRCIAPGEESEAPPPCFSPPGKMGCAPR